MKDSEKRETIESYHSPVMQDGKETGITTVYHRVQDLFSDQHHLVVPLQTNHGLWRATGDGCECRRL